MLRQQQKKTKKTQKKVVLDDGNDDEEVGGVAENVDPKKPPSALLNNEDDYEDDQRRNNNNPFLGEYKVSFSLTLVSCIIFLVSSGLYLYLATIGWEYQQEIKDFSAEALLADDSVTWHENGYEDDYVFVTPFRNVYVSEYTIVYCIAAFGFVVSGIVDYCQWRTFYSILMIAAAGFGLASASYTDTNPSRSNWLNACSLHLWALDAIAILIYFNRGSYGNSRILQWWLCIADVTFVIGTLIGLVLSWYYVLREPIRTGLSVAGVELFAAFCWLFTATIYLVATLFLGAQAQAVVKAMKAATITTTTPSIIMGPSLPRDDGSAAPAAKETKEVSSSSTTDLSDTTSNDSGIIMADDNNDPTTTTTTTTSLTTPNNSAAAAVVTTIVGHDDDDAAVNVEMLASR
jgi:hypothetical protein